MALVQRSSTASTQPRKGQTPSQATISKLSKAMSDPTKTQYGVTLKQNIARAPDGGAIADYPKGWRFLPVPHNSEAGEMLKKNPRVVEAMARLHDLSFVPSTKQYSRDPNAPYVHRQSTQKHQKTIADTYHKLINAPQIKAEKEQKEREEEEQRQTIATLKMRVQELTKKPIDKPTAPAVTSSLPIIPIIIIAVIVGIFLLRRRA